MARKVVWTRTAWNDLELVAEFISRDSEYYATALVREARDAVRVANLGFSGFRNSENAKMSRW